MKRRVYLDHAATRSPKPSIVLDAMHAFSTDHEAAAGRGAYRSSRYADEMVNKLRREIARWIGATAAQEISFHSGGTTALNAALLSVLRPGQHVVTTQAEHNSVLRPLYRLVSDGMISWTVVPVGPTGQVNPDDVLAAITPKTRLVAMVHAANVNGAVQPIEAIGWQLRERFADNEKPLLMIDAAQTFGCLPLSVTDHAIDLLAAPGHKSGHGPLGTGFLYAQRRLHHELRPSILGGTGTSSESLEMPRDYPSSFEAGNMNVPALAGWLTGLQCRYQNQPNPATTGLNASSPAQTPDQNIATLLQTSQHKLFQITEQLYAGLDAIPGVHVIGRPTSLALPVASIAIQGMAASDVAMILDIEFGIEVRSGLHCAALIHGALGSPDDGTVRISCCDTTTAEDLAWLFQSLAEISANG